MKNDYDYDRPGIVILPRAVIMGMFKWCRIIVLVFICLGAFLFVSGRKADEFQKLWEEKGWWV